MKVSERLILRLIAEGLMTEGETIQRLQRGYHGISAGAWAWCIADIRGRVHRGSDCTMQECVDAAKLTVFESRGGDFCIYAEN